MLGGPALHCDFETRSAVDLKKAGVYRYSESATTGVWCLAWCWEGGPTYRWNLGDAPTEPFVRMLNHVQGGGRVIAHNAGFERTIWNKVFGRVLGFPVPELRVEQQDCTMARAAALALPQGLDRLSPVLGGRPKDMEGHALMLRMCRPKKFTVDGAPVWEDDPAKIERQGVYCENDVASECTVDGRVSQLSAEERRVWELDQRINDRGFAIDVRLVQRALEAVEVAKARADREVSRLTGGAVTACTQTARIIDWLNSRGVPATSIAKGEVEEIILAGALVDDPVVEQVITLRRAAARSSNGKYKTMLGAVCADGRVRGSLAYHGAAPGRWAGRLVQPHNFPRVDEDLDLPDVKHALKMLEREGWTPPERVDALEVIGIKPLEVLSKSLRPMIIAPEGSILVGGDLANIEGRGNAYLAGEAWKLQAFCDYDAGTGPDLYKLTAAKVFGVPLDQVTKAQRQSGGKVSELSCGYQGGPGAYVTMGANYGIKPAAVAEQARSVTDPDVWQATLERYTKADSRGLEPQIWTGLKVIVDGWRAENAMIVKGWWEVQDAAIEAVQNPGMQVPCYGGKVTYLQSGAFLFCRLPSGRLMAYSNPRIVRQKTGRLDYRGNPTYKNTVFFDGVDSKTKKWGTKSLYGGLQCENIVQGFARDVMVHGMFGAEAVGFYLVLTVHDELLAEVRLQEHNRLNAALLEQTMMAPISWAPGLPLAAKAWADPRYIK